MRWDAKRRVYVDDNGRVMSAAQVRREVHDYVVEERNETEKKALELLAGAITIAAFFNFLKTRVETWHNVTGAIAYGGKAQLDPEREARIKAKVASELEYLANFKRDALAMLDEARTVAAESTLTVTETFAETAASIPSRAGMYADAAYSTYENNVMAREFDSGVTLGRRVCPEDDASCEECVAAADTFFSSLEDIPEIGSLTCLNNCRCFIEYAQPNPNIDLSVGPQAKVEQVEGVQ